MSARMPSRRQALLTGASALGAMVHGPSRGMAAIGKPETSQIRFGLTLDAASFASVYVAQEKTWPQSGLAIETSTFRGDAEVSQALAGDSLDISLQSPYGLISMVQAEIPAIAFYAGFHQADFWFVSQPSIKTWSDLKGGSAGVSTIGSLTDNLTRFVLSKNGLEPRKDVNIVQVGPTANALQALKAGRLSLAILSPPFKWAAQDAGFTVLGTQTKDIAPEWPKHVFVAKKKFLDENPNAVMTFLRGYVAALRMARADRELTSLVLAKKLKYSPDEAGRAFDEIMPGYDERGAFPAKATMDVFWDLEIRADDVKEAWPNEKLLDDRFIKRFADWAP